MEQQPGMKSDDRPRAGRRVRHGIEAAEEKYSGSAAEDLWHRLNALDFMNQAMILAGTLLLCVFPFLIVLSALAGRGVASSASRRLGLNQQAAADMGHLFTSSGATSATISTACLVLLVLFAFAGANAVQQVYERIFDLDSRGTRDMLRRMIWAALVVGWLFLGDLVGPWARAGGPVLFGHRHPGRVHRLLVVRDAVPAGREDHMAEAIAVRRGHRAVLAGHGGSLLGHLFRHGHLVRRQVRSDRYRVRPVVLHTRGRGGDHPGRGGGHRMARAEPVVPGRVQEIAAGPVTGGTGPGAEIWREARASGLMITWAVLRVVASVVVVTAVYYLLPFDRPATGVAVTLLVAGLVVFVALVAFQVRAITASPFPGLRAIEALATSVPLFLALFAGTYFVMARLSPGSFTAPLSRTDALYFTVTVFSTVGFGDITAKAETARLVVTGQMIADQPKVR